MLRTFDVIAGPCSSRPLVCRWSRVCCLSGASRLLRAGLPCFSSGPTRTPATGGKDLARARPIEIEKRAVGRIRILSHAVLGLLSQASCSVQQTVRWQQEHTCAGTTYHVADTFVRSACICGERRSAISVGKKPLFSRCGRRHLRRRSVWTKGERQ